MVTATQSLTDDMIELFAAEIGAEIRLVDRARSRRSSCRSVLGVDELLDDDDDDDDLRRTAAGHHRHGPRRPRQDQAARPHPRRQRGRRRGRWHHPAHRRLPGRQERPARITFIDTPGHEAFTAMRARGAEATDIVVLVVAADDGVMPQTLEASTTPRRPRCRSSWPSTRSTARTPTPTGSCSSSPSTTSSRGRGAATPCSRGLGPHRPRHRRPARDLLLVAEVEDLPRRPRGSGRASSSSPPRHRPGPVATVLVQRGTLRVGDPLVAGAAWGRVRALIDDHGEQIKEAGPSTPVQVLGLSDVADAGDSSSSPPTRRRPDVAEKREHYHRVANLGREAPPPAAAPSSRTSSSRSRPARSPPSTSSSRPT
jgi:translation initiation factor IF-2